MHYVVILERAKSEKYSVQGARIHIRDFGNSCCCCALTMATTADQLMAPALVPTSNGQQSVLIVGTKLQASTNSNSDSNQNSTKKKKTAAVQQQQQQHQHQVDSKRSALAKPDAMNASLKLKSSEPIKEVRVYKIVLTGGKFYRMSLIPKNLFFFSPFFCIYLFTMCVCSQSMSRSSGP